MANEGAKALAQTLPIMGDLGGPQLGEKKRKERKQKNNKKILKFLKIKKLLMSTLAIPHRTISVYVSDFL